MGRNPPTLGFRRHSLTSAKVQNFSRRTSVRPASEDGRGCPRLTDIFLTKWPRCGNKSLYIFNIIWLKNWPKAKQNMKNTPGVWGQSPHEKRGNAGIFFIVADILGHERKLSFMAAAVYGRTFGRNFLRQRPFTAEPSAAIFCGSDRLRPNLRPQFFAAAAVYGRSPVRNIGARPTNPRSWGH